jgi:flagellar motor switch protein FliM
VTEQILTEDEKNALLDGVTSGAVTVQTGAGAKYAAVRSFDIEARSRIVSNSYPRLQSINQRFAERLTGQAESLLQSDLDIRPVEAGLRSYAEISAGISGPVAAVVFSAAPLAGHALVVLRPELVSQLVEVFFGGPGDAAASGNENNTFSAGELSVSNLFCNLILATVQDAWQPLVSFAPVRLRTETSLDHVEPEGDDDAVIDTAFEVSMSGEQSDRRGRFHILWPRDMVAPLLPAFDGRRRERDPATDARWEQSIRRRLADAPMKLTTRVGFARLALGDVIALAPGDVIPIGSPKSATVLANDVPVINGRFGIFGGRNAVEAGDWLTASDLTLSPTHR